MKNTVNQIVNELYEYYGRFGIPVLITEESKRYFDFYITLTDNKGGYCGNEFFYWNAVDIGQCGQFSTPLNTELGKALYD